ncbi:hypothetical protein [Thalassotalea ganghwensis]
MPISEQELHHLEQLGQEINACLTTIFNGLPNDARTIKGLSQLIGYNNSNCQRLLKALSIKNDGINVITALPGVAALEEFSLKSKTHINDNLHEHFSHLVQEFADTLKASGKSHAKLKSLLQPKVIKVGASSPSKTCKRENLYYAAKDLLGASIDHIFCGHILTINTFEDEYLHEIAMISKQGVYRNKHALPCLLHYSHPHPSQFNGPELITSDSRLDKQRFNIGIVDEYSSKDLNQAYNRFSPSNLGLIFDDLNNQGRPFDATFLMSNPDELVNPLVNRSQCSSTFLTVKSPTKKLTMMVFLERKIDMRSSVSVGCYLSNEKVEDKRLRDADISYEQMSNTPDVKIVNLNSLPDNSKDKALANYMFQYADLDSQDFVCYLIEVNYPIWSSTYRIYFDHV